MLCNKDHSSIQKIMQPVHMNKVIKMAATVS